MKEKDRVESLFIEVLPKRKEMAGEGLFQKVESIDVRIVL